MRGAALRQGQFVDVGALFTYATDQVPQFARDIGGIQRPLVSIPTGGASFDIGQLTEVDKTSVPLQTARPLILRASFQEEQQFKDVLGLGRRVNELLIEASGRGQKAE